MSSRDVSVAEPEPPVDTRFSLPSVDDPPLTEIGVILLGLDAERLLAGLGIALVTDDPALITLAVDQIRHGALGSVPPEDIVAAGAHRWRVLRPTLAAAGLDVVPTGSLRLSWERVLRVLAGALPGAASSVLAYLAACWLRRDEVDELARGT